MHASSDARYSASTIGRKRIEKPFGWSKTVGGVRNAEGNCPKRLILIAAAYSSLPSASCLLLEPHQ
jgi:hypothetical protein